MLFTRADQTPARASINANELTPLDETSLKDKVCMCAVALRRPRPPPPPTARARTQVVVAAKGAAGEASVVIGIDFIPVRARDAACAARRAVVTDG